MFPTIPYSNFGLTGTGNVPGPQPNVGGTSSKFQKLNHTTLSQQTTRVGGYQPNVCRDNIVAALTSVHTEGTNRLPVSGLGTSNSTFSNHKLFTTEDNVSVTITPMLPDNAAGLDHNDDSFDETSISGHDATLDRTTGDDDGLTFNDYEEHPNDEAPLYVVPQRNILPMNDILKAKVELLI